MEPRPRKSRTTQTDLEPIRRHLKRLGLSEYEVRAYLGLLQNGPLSGGDLVAYADVPQKRIYQVLARLIDLRLVDKRPQKGGAYQAHGVRALRSLTDTRKIEVLSMAEELERGSREIFTAVAALDRDSSGQNVPLEFVEIVVGAEQYRLVYSHLLQSTRREMLSFTKPPFLTSADASVNGIDLLGRDVRIRCVYEWGVSGPTSEPHRQMLRVGLTDFVEAGEEARILPTLPVKIIIFDRSSVLLNLQDPTTGALPPSAVLVRHPAFAEMQAQAFECYWAKAKPVTPTLRRTLLRQLDEPA